MDRTVLFRLVDKNLQVIVPLNETREGIPFFCVHAIGGDAASFKALARHVEGQFPFYGIQVPKQHLNATFAGSIDNIAEYYVEAVTSLRPEGGVVIGGWSAGAVIALEMAQRLRALGRDVKLLVLFDGYLPDAVGRTAASAPSTYWNWVRNLPRWINDSLRTEGGARRVAHKIKAKLRLIAASYGLRRTEVHRLDTVIDMSSWPEGPRAFACALYDAVERYSPKFYAGDVLLYTGKTRPFHKLYPIAEAWVQIAAAIETVEVEGTHSNLLQEPHVVAVAEDLRARLFRLTHSRTAIGASDPMRPQPSSVEELQCR